MVYHFPIDELQKKLNRIAPIALFVKGKWKLPKKELSPVGEILIANTYVHTHTHIYIYIYNIKYPRKHHPLC